jgi:hypothetical protein
MRGLRPATMSRRRRRPAEKAVDRAERCGLQRKISVKCGDFSPLDVTLP